MNHGEGDGVGPIVQLPIQNVLVVDDDHEGEEDPDGDVGVGEDDLLEHALAQIAAFPHCWSSIDFSCGGGGRDAMWVREVLFWLIVICE